MNIPNSFIVSAYMYKRRRTRPIIKFTEGVSTRLYKYIIISRVQSMRKTLRWGDGPIVSHVGVC